MTFSSTPHSMGPKQTTPSSFSTNFGSGATYQNRRKPSENLEQQSRLSHSDSKNNVLGLYAGYERDRNISFCCPLVLNHATVTAEGFCDNLKNGLEMFSSFFEMLQPARPTKIGIFCWNLVCKLKLSQTIEPQNLSQFGHSSGAMAPNWPFQLANFHHFQVFWTLAPEVLFTRFWTYFFGFYNKNCIQGPLTR